MVPARRVGRRLQDISREQMEHNAAMNTQMTERFNVVRRDARQAVRLARPRERRRSARAPTPCATPASARRCSAGCSSSRSVWSPRSARAAIYGIGAQLVVDGDDHRPARSSRSRRWSPRVYQPLTGLDERPRRPDDVDGLVRARVRGARRSRADHREARARSTSSTRPGRIEFDDVMFRYPPAEASRRSPRWSSTRSRSADPDGDVLRGLDARRSSPARRSPLVGASGAGKSTLASLIPRLYDVTGGAVRIDGIDVRDLTLDSLRATIGVVSQDPHLFHESIGDNLRYADPDATDDRARRRRTAARIHDTIAALPDGYDTIVGERGYRLVGRREAATRDRPAAAEEPGDHDPRRGDEPSRQRQRGPRPGVDRRRARRVARRS